MSNVKDASKTYMFIKQEAGVAAYLIIAKIIKEPFYLVRITVIKIQFFFFKFQNLKKETIPRSQKSNQLDTKFNE